MVDVFTPEKRSEVMSRIRGRNTKPEILVRSMLHGLGYRFTVNGPLNRRLPGRPDIVLPKLRVVVLVHGCFWHAHEHCADYRLPKTRTQWWKAKLEGNRARYPPQPCKGVRTKPRVSEERAQPWVGARQTSEP